MNGGAQQMLTPPRVISSPTSFPLLWMRYCTLSAMHSIATFFRSVGGKQIGLSSALEQLGMAEIAGWVLPDPQNWVAKYSTQRYVDMVTGIEYKKRDR